MASPVIDVHTHVLTEAWFDLLKRHGAPRYSVKEVTGGLRAIHLDGAPFMTPVPPMFDYDLRLATMDKCGVDVCVVSLTCPNVFWGGPNVSLEAARIMNDDMAAAQRAHPDRLRWFASLPWQYPERALAELERTHANGACGVMASIIAVAISMWIGTRANLLIAAATYLLLLVPMRGLYRKSAL